MHLKRLGEARRSQWTTGGRLALERAGVFRLEGRPRGKPLPSRALRIVFTGDCNQCPTFHFSEESHPVAPDRPPGEQGGSSMGVQEPSLGGQAPPTKSFVGRVCWRL